jgi:adenylate cyclase
MAASVDRAARILVVDDTPQNIKVLEAMLVPRGYSVLAARSGPEALGAIARDVPDLVLLDVVMPGMDGFEVCRRLRAYVATQMLPIVMITASAEKEKVRSLEVGADDFLQKPFNQAELLARVRSLVRIRRYQETIEQQAAELAQWNQRLEQRVREQVDQLDRLGRLRRFLPSRLAELLVSTDGEALLDSHRRQIAVVSCRLDGFSQLAEASAPEEVLTLLSSYYEAIGAAVLDFEGTVGPLVEDRVTVVFNDPLPTEDPARQAVVAALAAREGLRQLTTRWRRNGFDLDFGIGIDMGYATLGMIGFAGRTDYGAIGSVVHVAGRLCDAAKNGQILVSQRVRIATEQVVEATDLGQQSIAGVTHPVAVFAIDRDKGGASGPRAPIIVDSGPLTEREQEVVSLIVRGCTNREIATELVIAEGTAVRHVANILSKLGLRSRAQVAVWAVDRGLLGPSAC